MRYNENTTELIDQHTLITKHFYNKYLLDMLTSSLINNKEKLEIIHKENILNEPIIPNLLAGGLLDDYNFEF